jgi:hypothetical protein
LQDIYPSADPQHYGLLVVPDAVIDQMTLHKYRVDRQGKPLLRPVLQEKTKALLAVPDSALGQSVLAFGEPYVEIKSITDVKDKTVQATAVDAAKGIVGLGARSGYFTVTCTVDTGVAAPEVVAQEKNWDWVRDSGGNVAGMKLLK